MRTRSLNQTFMKWFLFFPLLFLLLQELPAQTKPTFSQQEVIYGHKDGMALTMEVLTPKTNANHKAIIFVVSGRWFSTRDWLASAIQQSEAFLQRGYTGFAVTHSSQPNYTVPEVIPDIERAVRFVRFHAKQYGINPDFLGITGGSAGGHLSLVVATADDTVDPNAKDPVDQVSSRVQAVACFFPPTDFVNYGKAGANVVVNKTVLDGAKVHAALRFTKWDSTLQYFVPITNLEKRTQIVKQISPITRSRPMTHRY
jgi:acetyl esterase/lipase